MTAGTQPSSNQGAAKPIVRRVVYSDGTDSRGRDILRSVTVDQIDESDPDFITITSGKLVISIGRRFVNRIERWLDDLRGAEADEIAAFIRANPTATDYEVSK